MYHIIESVTVGKEKEQKSIAKCTVNYQTDLTNSAQYRNNKKGL